MAELVDAGDLKSLGITPVRVQVPLPAPLGMMRVCGKWGIVALYDGKWAGHIMVTVGSGRTGMESRDTDRKRFPWFDALGFGDCACMVQSSSPFETRSK